MISFRIITLITALVIFGEALALTIGMVLVTRAKNPWLTLRNVIFLFLDLAMGVALIYLAWSDGVAQPLFFGLSLVLLLTHAYRDLEFWHGAPTPFCFNRPLFIVNNFKLLGLMVVTFWSLFL